MAAVGVALASFPWKRLSCSPFSPSFSTIEDPLCRLPSSPFPKSDSLSKSCSQWPSSPNLFRLLQQHHHRHFVAFASAGREVYQPFRPPPSSSPAYENVSIEEQLEILRDRRGLWFDYAVHVPSLLRAGFTPSTIDEITGMTGVEQNKIVVGSQVRSSLQMSGMDEATLASFDIGGADILYELRYLTGRQRKSAAEFALERRMDVKDCRDLARAIKDYERRGEEEGKESFSFIPGDCLAFACYRQSKEYKTITEKESILKKGLTYAVSEKAKFKMNNALEKGEVEVDVQKVYSRLQVIRLIADEAGTWSEPYVLPVVNPTVEEIEAAPAASVRKGPFSVQYSETPWNSWIAIPRWQPIQDSVAPFVIPYPNGSFLPWKPKTKKELEEPVLLVVDKHFTELHAETYFLVASENGMVGLQLGTVVAETESKTLGKAVVAIRLPQPQSREVTVEDFDD